MPKLHRLKKMCEAEELVPEITPEIPSWCMVCFLLLKDEGYQIHPGAVVAASAESTLFSYALESILPMYLNTIGGDDRLELMTGYKLNGIRTNNAEEAFQFIKKGIDTNKGVFISGPEMSICYGYKDDQNVSSRSVFGIANWGPGLYGELSWEKFKQFVERFGNNEGLKVFMPGREAGTKEKIVEMIIETAVDWQESHPGINFGLKRENYGLISFRQFINDLSDSHTRTKIDDAYINCHIISDQMGGRYWLGSYLKDLARQFGENLRTILDDTGNLYMESSKKLKEFINSDIKEKKENEISKAITLLRDAYIFEERIIENFKHIRSAL